MGQRIAACQISKPAMEQNIVSVKVTGLIVFKLSYIQS